MIDGRKRLVDDFLSNNDSDGSRASSHVLSVRMGLLEGVMVCNSLYGTVHVISHTALRVL